MTKEQRIAAAVFLTGLVISTTPTDKPFTPQVKQELPSLNLPYPYKIFIPVAPRQPKQ